MYTSISGEILTQLKMEILVDFMCNLVVCTSGTGTFGGMQKRKRKSKIFEIDPLCIPVAECFGCNVFRSLLKHTIPP